MPKQIGLIRLQGKLGDTSFYKSKDGYLAREKGGVSGDRIKTDPKFKRTRENMAEFGHSNQKAADFRKLLAPVIQKIKGHRMSNRLVQVVRKAMNADTTHPRGERLLVDGDLSLMEGFEFNSGSPLSSTYFGTYETNLDRVTGAVDVAIPDFDPDDFLVGPAESTHFRFVMGVLEWDITNEKGKLVVERSAYLQQNGGLTGAVNLSGSISANSTLPVFLCWG